MNIQFLFSTTSVFSIIRIIKVTLIIIFIVVLRNLALILAPLFSKLLNKALTLIFQFGQRLWTHSRLLRIASIPRKLFLHVSLIWTCVLRRHLIVLIVFINAFGYIEESFGLLSILDAGVDLTIVLLLVGMTSHTCRSWKTTVASIDCSQDLNHVFHLSTCVVKASDDLAHVWAETLVPILVFNLA